MIKLLNFFFFVSRYLVYHDIILRCLSFSLILTILYEHFLSLSDFHTTLNHAPTLFIEDAFSIFVTLRIGLANKLYWQQPAKP